MFAKLNRHLPTRRVQLCRAGEMCTPLSLSLSLARATFLDVSSSFARFNRVVCALIFIRVLISVASRARRLKCVHRAFCVVRALKSPLLPFGRSLGSFVIGSVFRIGNRESDERIVADSLPPGANFIISSVDFTMRVVSLFSFFSILTV